jgi:flagellar biosynthetic protein FliQ
MTPEVVIDVSKDAMLLIVLMVAVIVVPSLLVGLVVSMFQAATQINEQTLSFLPRLLMTLGTIMVLGPWLINLLMEHATRLMSNIPFLIG